MTDPLIDKQLAEIRKRVDAVVAAGEVPLQEDVEKLLEGLAVGVERLEARNKELEDLFHLQQSRMGEAVELWRRSTGRDDATPPLGDLLTFLLREIEELRTRPAQ